MDFAVIAAIILMIVITLWWVLQPLWQPDQTGSVGMPAGSYQTLEELRHRRDAIYAAIKDLELDLSGNKVSDADYQQLRRQLTAQAAQLLKHIDQLSTHADQDLEAEIDALVSEFEADEVTMNALQAAIQTELSPDNDELPHRTCPQCQHLAPLDATFCGQCGTALNHLCPSCQNQVNPSDLFCTHCGTNLAAEVVE